jgi:dienelactone hydrolase
MVVDALRSLEWLRRDRRIDPHRIAVIGFSRGGLAALAVGQRRLQRLAGLQGAGFAAAVAFYPALWLRLQADLERDGAPVLVLQGDADDYVGSEQLRLLAAELRAAGAPLELCWLPGAGHLFDGPAMAPAVFRPRAQTLQAAQIVESDPGVLLNSVTGEPFSWSDPQVGHGATLAYDPSAHAAARRAVAAFLGRVLGLPSPQAPGSPGW